MTKRFGFTLAEVLITLGIIGVVAAMTMPTLMNSTQGAQYKVAYKKALSAISQAIVLNIALDDYSLADTTTATATTGTQNMYAIFKNRMNVVKTGTTSTGYAITEGGAAFTQGSTNYTMFFNDGIAITFPQDTAECNETAVRAGTKCRGFIDVNGQKGPNKVVACDGSTSGDNCTVTNPTDVYPVIFYDQTLLPNSPAARAVLYGK